MKLVIDIDEDVYTRLFDSGIQDNEIAVNDVCEMARALRLGTPLEVQLCEDCVSRQAALDTIGNVPDYDDGMVWEALSHAQRDVALLPSVTPKYTDEEIDKAQAVEQAYVDKMVELAVEEAEQRPKGKWIKEKDCLLVYRCSNCKKFVYSRESESDEKFEELSRLDSYKYCPRCGAYMGGEKDEDGD